MDRADREDAMLRLAGTSAFAVAAVCLVFTPTSGIAEDVYPQITDSTHAAPETAKFFASFFNAKSRHDVAKTMAHFSPNLVTYTDATLGWDLGGFDGVKKIFEMYMPKWPAAGKSYPTRILGGPNSALVAFTDTPELFGAELRIFGSLDLRDGKIVRWVDYWDSRSLDRSIDAALRQPPEKFSKDLKEKEVGENASANMQAIAAKMQKAFAAGDAKAAAALLSYDATYEDMTLRTQVRGSAAIERYLARILATAPFGQGSKLRHVVGSDLGGGFEWIGTGSLGGITALSLDPDGQVTAIRTVYDGRLVNDATLKSLVVLSLDP
jgi:ketosteroid isomerase-like protein